MRQAWLKVLRFSVKTVSLLCRQSDSRHNEVVVLWFGPDCQYMCRVGYMCVCVCGQVCVLNRG